MKDNLEFEEEQRWTDSKTGNKLNCTKVSVDGSRE